jgi:hypothetical protein
MIFEQGWADAAIPCHVALFFQPFSIAGPQSPEDRFFLNPLKIEAPCRVPKNRQAVGPSYSCSGRLHSLSGSRALSGMFQRVVRFGCCSGSRLSRVMVPARCCDIPQTGDARRSRSPCSATWNRYSDRPSKSSVLISVHRSGDYFSANQHFLYPVAAARECRRLFIASVVNFNELEVRLGTGSTCQSWRSFSLPCRPRLNRQRSRGEASSAHRSNAPRR